MNTHVYKLYNLKLTLYYVLIIKYKNIYNDFCALKRKSFDWYKFYKREQNIMYYII